MTTCDSSIQNSAYQSGYEAGREGLCPNTVCPYDLGDPLIDVWSRGWFDGDRSTDRETIQTIRAEVKAVYGR